MFWHMVTQRKGSEGGNWRTEWVASTLHTTSEHGVSSITSADAHTSAASSRLNWRPPADLNGLVRFAERRNLDSARVPSHFKWPLPLFTSGCQLHCTQPQGDTCESWNYCGKRCISYRRIFYVSQSRMFYSWTCDFNLLYLVTSTIDNCDLQKTIGWNPMHIKIFRYITVLNIDFHFTLSCENNLKTEIRKSTILPT